MYNYLLPGVTVMRKILSAIIIVCAVLVLCACGEEKELGKWTMPRIESRPTAVPTAAPEYSSVVSAPEKYVWNELEGFDMSMPGVEGKPQTLTVKHAESMELFGGQFIPKMIFTESYGSYEKKYLEQKDHDILADGNGALARNAYVEYRYLNKAWVEAGSITVMAELCDYPKVMDIYSARNYPHIYCAGGAVPELSRSYLDSFVLAKLGDTRYAQWLVLPSGYFAYVEEEAAAARQDEREENIQPQILLTFTCREKVSDEEFTAAVLEIGRAAAGSRVLPEVVIDRHLPKPGEKGAA